MVEDRGIVGIFWVTSSKEGADIVSYGEKFDMEKLNCLVEHEEPHNIMWKLLAKEQFEGKYIRYDDKYFSRGKVVYDRDLHKTFVYVDKKIFDIIDKIDESLRDIFFLEDYEYIIDEQYQSIMNLDDELHYSIIRGKSIIGGNLIEIYYGKTKILVELGKELGSEEELTEQEEVVINTNYDAVIISHYHGDHAGLVEQKKDCPIYMGEGTKGILEAIDKYKGKEEAGNFLTYANCKSFNIGSIMITPYLCDHSAYDSHMLLFEGGGKSILYTGDYRFSGRKSKYRLLRDLPNKVDTLISEGTNIKNNKEIVDNNEENYSIDANTDISQEKVANNSEENYSIDAKSDISNQEKIINNEEENYSIDVNKDICNREKIINNKEEGGKIRAKTEQKIEEIAVQIMEENKDKPVFILQSSTNIDRIVSFYRASKKTKRVFYMDNYQAQIVEAVGNKIPRPDVFYNVFTFVSSRIQGCRYDYLKNIKQKKRLTQIGQSGKFTMLIRQSMFMSIAKISKSLDLKDSILIYSLWEGYKEEEEMKKFLQKIEKLGIKIVSLHTSGHASPKDIEKLSRRVKSDEFVLVHTNNINAI